MASLIGISIMGCILAVDFVSASADEVIKTAARSLSRSLELFIRIK